MCSIFLVQRRLSGWNCFWSPGKCESVWDRFGGHVPQTTIKYCHPSLFGPYKKNLCLKSQPLKKNLLEAEYSEPLKCAFKFLYQKHIIILIIIIIIIRWKTFCWLCMHKASFQSGEGNSLFKIWTPLTGMSTTNVVRRGNYWNSYLWVTRQPF